MRPSVSVLACSLGLLIAWPAIADSNQPTTGINLSSRVRHGGGPAPATHCVTIQDEALIASQKPTGLRRAVSPTLLLMADPVGGGGINSPGKPTNNYVDLDSTAALRDWHCGTVTYDGHAGSDIDLTSFYDMDEGVAILAAAPGIVTFSHDGEFDRNTSIQPSAVANAVIVTSADGTQEWYWHMRKNSVRVKVNDIVNTGDTLGFIGSSGYSTTPHLHFEMHDNQGTLVEPYNGACQSNASRWQSQKPYILDEPFVLMSQGVTTIPLDWPTAMELPPSKTHVQAGQTIYSWITQSSGHSTDQLRWDLYSNNILWNSYSFSLGGEIRHGWWYTSWNLPAASNYFGNWSIKIFLNGVQIAQQDFTFDNLPDQRPTVPSKQFAIACQPFDSEFDGVDADGSIFWYDIQSGPSHGTLSQYGGRKRKFSYTPTPGYSGFDSIAVSARDDEDLSGPVSYYVFQVNSDCCCVGKVGNVDGTGIADLADLTALVSYLTGAGFVLPCRAAANVTGDQAGVVDAADLSALVSYLTNAGYLLPSCR